MNQESQVMQEKDLSQHPLILTVERILAMHPNMTEAEKLALADWEAANLGSGDLGTTDWPGWSDVYARLSH